MGKIVLFLNSSHDLEERGQRSYFCMLISDIDMGYISHRKKATIGLIVEGRVNKTISLPICNSIPTLKSLWKIFLSLLISNERKSLFQQCNHAKTYLFPFFVCSETKTAASKHFEIVKDVG